MQYVFMTDTRIIYIMNFVRGGDLLTHIMKMGGFPEDIVQFITAQLVVCLGYLHNNNIVYRDLKLENILLEEDGYIKLVDFGISK
mmetsp:Transcript_27163/g.26214  ORF Transcript_27163/g.26214 Transcript_27163/m.26214 type:complete len:85 (-) Transcript_27163:468-722(-)